MSSIKRKRSAVKIFDPGAAATAASKAAASSTKKRKSLPSDLQRQVKQICEEVLQCVREHPLSKSFEEIAEAEVAEEAMEEGDEEQEGDHPKDLQSIEERLNSDKDYAGLDFYGDLISLFLDPDAYEEDTPEHAACFLLQAVVENEWRARYSIPQVRANSRFYQPDKLGSVPKRDETSKELNNAERSRIVNKLATLSGRELTRLVHLLREQEELDFGGEELKISINVDDIDNDMWRRIKASFPKLFKSK